MREYFEGSVAQICHILVPLQYFFIDRVIRQKNEKATEKGEKLRDESGRVGEGGK